MDEVQSEQSAPVQPAPPVTPPPSVTPVTHSFSVERLFVGRLNRWNYFIAGFIYGLIFFIICLVYSLIAFRLGYSIQSVLAYANNPLFTFLNLVWVTPLTARRLHDLGYSGWLVLGVFVTNFIPLVNLAVSLYLLFKKGNELPNKYGPPDTSDGTLKTIFGLS